MAATPPTGPPAAPASASTRHQARADGADDLLARCFRSTATPMDLERAKVTALVSIASSLAILADNAMGQTPPAGD